MEMSKTAILPKIVSLTNDGASKFDFEELSIDYKLYKPLKQKKIWKMLQKLNLKQWRL